MNRRRYLLLLVPVLLSARAVQAGSVETKERTARMACLSGDFAKGVAILSELFVDTEDPAYIYNQGRCFEQNRRYEDAIARFQEFLRAGKKLSKNDKVEAQKHIASCQTLVAKQVTSQTSVPGPDSSKELKERAARKACLAGNADKGSEILSDLWLDYQDPTHIYNLGRCYEQNHRYEDAVSRFREYLLKAQRLTDADRAETEKHIATCLAYLGRTDTAQPAQTPSRAQPTQPRTVETQKAAMDGIGTPSVVEARSNDDTIGAVATQTSATTPKSHARQLGLFFRFERVLAPGVSYGILGGLEVEAGALIGYYRGTWLGLRYLLFDGAVKPGLAIGMPIFLVGGKAVAGIEGSAVVQWDFTCHVGVYASIGVSYFPRTAPDLVALWFLPGIGAQVRL